MHALFKFGQLNHNIEVVLHVNIFCVEFHYSKAGLELVLGLEA